MLPPAHKNLPRLGREWYQGRAFVFWTHSIHGRAPGWLDDGFHAAFCHLLLHACARYSLVCPAYVLMPDHWHLILIGTRDDSDQWVATAFLRKHIGPRLLPHRLQDRVHDHVLRETEREKGALAGTCQYIRENPIRGGLCADVREWRYGGALIPGFPTVNPDLPDFWQGFWRIYNWMCARASVPALHAQGYGSKQDYGSNSALPVVRSA